MNIAISTAVLNYLPFDDALKIIREAGYDYIELAGYSKSGDWEVAQHLKGIKPKDVILMVNDNGLRISTFHDMGGMIGAGTESIVSGLTYEYLNSYDFPCVVFHTPYKKDGDRNWWVNYRYSVMKDLRALGNKIVCIENIFPRGYYMPFARPEDMLDFLNESNFYANIDTTHYAHNGIDIVNAAEVLRERVKTIHLSDYLDNKQHLFIGEGSLDFVSFFNKLDINGLHSVTIECTIPPDNEDAIIEKVAETKMIAKNILASSDLSLRSL